MKKLLYVFLVSVSSILFLTSCGGLATTFGSVSIKLMDENGKPVSKEVLKDFKCILIKKYDQSVRTNDLHEEAIYINMPLCHYRTNITAKRGMKKSINKLLGNSIKISDTKDRYQDIVMDPLPKTGYTVKAIFHGYPSWIEYTVQLKKK